MQPRDLPRPARKKLSVPFTALAAITLIVAGCGGGGGGSSDNTSSGTTYSGVVEAPSGTTLAQSGMPGIWKGLENLVIPETVAGVTGLEPKADVTVSLVELDDNGNVLGTVETVKTDSAGKFTLETELSPSTNYIFRVESSNDQMRVPMTKTDVDINPGTEMVVQSAEQAITNGSKMSDWSPEEVTSLVDSVHYNASNCTDIGGCVTVIDTAYPHMDKNTEALATNDGVTGPEGEFPLWGLSISHTRGFYEVGHYLERYSLSLGGDEFSGELILENDALWHAGTTEMELVTDTSGESLEPSSAIPGSNGLLAMGPSHLDGFYSRDNKVIALADHWSDDVDFNGTNYTEDMRGLLVGIQKASSAPTLSGNFHTISLGTETGETATSSQDGYRLYRSSYGLYTFDSANGSFSYSGETEEESELVLPGTDTGTSGSITGPTSGTNSGSGNLSVTSDGTLKLNGSVAGQVHPDGDFLLVGDYENNSGDPDWAEASLYLGVKAGTGMGNGDLSGTYNYVKLAGALESDGNGGFSDNADLEIGAATFDGAGSITYIASTRYESWTGFDGASSGIETNLDSGPDITYSVSTKGKVTVGSTPELVGAITPDKDILVLRGALDIDNQYAILIGFKQP